VITEEVILAAGCFWGVEYHFSKLNGVLKTEVGYTGGFVDDPLYELVCNSNTSHVEAVRIIYDPKIIDYRHIIQFFFEIHDFQQEDGQGGDIGYQYLSNIFYYSEVQKKLASDIIHQLQDMGYKVATQLKPVTTFWKAEDYHQKYYNKNGQLPYCHSWKQIF
jgi:peptide methionine sulfoxide reductase msrA/msrB